MSAGLAVNMIAISKYKSGQLYPVLVFVFVMGIAGWSIAKPALDTETYAQGAVKKCASSTDRAACYETVLPALYPQLSTSQLFDVIRMVRQKDPSYQFCHVLAHKLGERVVAEDPEKWVDAISLNPADGLCSNGFVHGVTGGRFRSEVLSDKELEENIPDFTRACVARSSWAASDLDRAICYHGMGHLYDFITNANIPKALDICARTVPADYRRMCIEGVFMQIYQPLEPDDFELIKQMKVHPTKDTVRQYCAIYKDPEDVGACLRESWPFFDQGIRDGTAASAFCSGQPDAMRTEYCYQSVSSIIGRMSLDDVRKAASACGKFLPQWQGMCFGYSAEAVLQESRTEAGKAVALCGMAPVDAAEECLAHLLGHADFIFGKNKEEFKSFCAALPPEFEPQCIQRYTDTKQ